MFLHYCTGAAMVCVESIKVSFTDLDGAARRPVGSHLWLSARASSHISVITTVSAGNEQYFLQSVLGQNIV